jgi:hypothetical protein
LVVADDAEDNLSHGVRLCGRIPDETLKVFAIACFTDGNRRNSRCLVGPPIGAAAAATVTEVATVTVTEVATATIVGVATTTFAGVVVFIHVFILIFFSVNGILGQPHGE